jgi:hypothetical protein
MCSPSPRSGWKTRPGDSRGVHDRRTGCRRPHGRSPRAP